MVDKGIFASRFNASCETGPSWVSLSSEIIASVSIFKWQPSFFKHDHAEKLFFSGSV
jgi:hypothetical protein